MQQPAVALIIFNRPRFTDRTFRAIQAQRPKTLFVIADGPREDHPADVDLCREARAVVERIDWPCEVHRNYADVNCGLKSRVSSGLDWVFSQVERAIVLEDDCVPHPDFFEFCAALLERHADDPRVAVVTGSNFQGGRRRGEAAYYFSRYNHCWGWATWRRAWTHYRGDLPFWEEWKGSTAWREALPDPLERRYWEEIFDRVRGGDIDSWAYPWTACVWYHGGLTATPNVNLVSNIGFGREATHTRRADDDFSDMPALPLGKLDHPDIVTRDEAADRYTFDRVFGGRQLRWPRSLLRLPRRLARGLLKRIRRTHPST